MEYTSKRVALITGGSGALGFASARRLAETDYRLILAARDPERLEQARKSLLHELPGTLVNCHPSDLSNEQEVKGLFQAIQKDFGRLDLLVNTAGVLLDRPLIMTRPSELQDLFAVNVYSCYHCCQYASRLMSARRQGVILNFSSLVGEQGAAGQSAYAACKAAVSGLTKALAKELAPLGIRVNALAPGFIDSSMTAHYSAELRERIISETLLKRAGTPEDVAGLVVYLASDQAAYLTGQIICIDGGLHL